MTIEKLESTKAALLLIDHQDGTVRAVKSIDTGDMKSNAVMLAKAACILGLPAVLTSALQG